MNSFQLTLCGFLIVVATPLTLGEVARNTSDFFPTVEGNLSAITWAHGVNSQASLKTALNDSTMMLEGDVVLGKVINNDSVDSIPIMAHPPSQISDLSLEDFLNQVLNFNTNSSDKKGIKLDFKTIDVVDVCVPILKAIYAKMNCPLWLNADILPGPVNSTEIPVDSNRFLTSAKTFENATLSLGWKTVYGGNITTASYSEEDINKMTEFVQSNNVTQPVTFPVRAGIAAQSVDQLKKLTDNVTSSTLTLWHGNEDDVDIDNLRVLIRDVGLSRVYVDVPDDLKYKLRLDDLGAGSNVKPLAILSIVLIAFITLL